MPFTTFTNLVMVKSSVGETGFHCHKCVNETFPFVTFLEILVRKCGVSVCPPHPLFLRAQHRGFLAVGQIYKWRFFKNASSSAAYTDPILLEGAWVMAWPHPLRARAGELNSAWCKCRVNWLSLNLHQQNVHFSEECGA